MRCNTAKAVPSDFIQLSPRQQAQLIDGIAERVIPPPPGAPAVCLLDTGVNRGHPLLALAIDASDVLTCDPIWPAGDMRGHGTELAGICLYGCLTHLLSSQLPRELRHRLESVKMLPDGGANPVEHYGAIMVEAVARAQIAAPTRNRAICMAVTADDHRDKGFPSAWSAAVDQLCSGADDSLRRLMFISAGNTSPEWRHEYPQRNLVESVEDPSQAFNAITVGACTELDTIREVDFAEWKPIAPFGGISPSSRTSVVWDDKSWPAKPDIVMEGGNCAIDPATGLADYVDDLSLLTTKVSPTGQLLTITGDTSAAAAQAARLGAMIWAEYPRLWPETVRALIVNSAQWTPAMKQAFTNREQLLRAVGHGVPNVDRALYSLSNAATLIVEESLQPFVRDSGDMKTKDVHFHHLKWPKDLLQELGDLPVAMRVTLSYFVEPSPGRRWTSKHRYQSHGLRFDVKRPTERIDGFYKRITRAAWDDRAVRPTAASEETRRWDLGQVLRTKGSLHQDTWHGVAANLAECGTIAVYPVTGWWRERAHLGRWSKSARYALVISIETPRSSVDLYTPIETLNTQEIEIEGS